MTRRALLIGSQTYGLTGCDADVGLMEDVLGGRGFDSISRLTGADASRKGVVQAFDNLIDATGPDDAVVVYYSGHGGRQRHPAWEERQRSGLSPWLQYIVPWDIDASSEDEFRGILAEELTDFQWQLTERTKNVTTILDCCHSGYMARAADLVPKAISRTFPVDGALALVAAIPPSRRDGTTHTNPDAVRIVACQPDQSAFERRSARIAGATHGIFTEELATLLVELGTRDVTWTTIADLVRQRVQGVAAQQRPEVEGPGDRLAFSLATRARPYALPFRSTADGAVIEPASLLEVSAGDTFRLLAPDSDEELATAAVDRIEGDRAILAIQLVAPVAALPQRGDAVPVSRALPKRSIAVEGSTATRDALVTAVEASPRLRVAQPGDVPFATITGNGRLVVTDGVGLRLSSAELGNDDAGRRMAIELVERQAAAERLIALTSGEGAAALSAPVDVGLRRHLDGESVEVASQGERLFVGDRLSLTLRNLGQEDVFVWLFDVGVSGRISLLTNASPSGLRLSSQGTAGDTTTIGGPAGTAMSWPADVPGGAERPEAFVAIIGDRQQDLSLLATRATRRAAGVATSGLDAILEEYRSGVREWTPDTPVQPFRYRIERIQFFLSPNHRPQLDEPAFELDDRPDPSVRALLPRAVEPPPGRIAVRLTELLVRRNRALFRADIRVDTLVVTRASAGDRGIADARTFRFGSIGDAEMLPLDDVLLYHGDVRDFVELAIWVSRDRGQASDLADAFATEMNDDKVKKALAALGAVALAAPQVAVGIGAVAAVATLVGVGARLVKAATGSEIGTYRTSRLAFERYGAGRTPPSGRRQARDVEFAYEIVDVT